MTSTDQIVSCPANLQDLFQWSLDSIHPDLLGNMHDPEKLAKEVIQSPAWGIHTFPLFTPEFCQALVWFTDLVGGHKPDPLDPYPGQELRTAEIVPLHEVIDQVFTLFLVPLVKLCFDGFEVTEIVNSFVLRYSMDSQVDMGLHFDADAVVSLTVVLDDGFEGGGLEFPKYDWSTQDLPVGHAVAFPSKVTHHHRVPPITSGERHALAFWLK